MLTRIQVALRSPDAGKRLVDYIAAGILYRLPVSIRKGLFRGKQHTCPVCGSSVSKFLHLNRAYHLYCPVCRSLQRHRLLWLLIQKEGLLQPQIPQRMLHFAPEACLTSKFTSLPQLEYISADLYESSAMVKMDIAHIQFPDNSFDDILCSHVLEHVPDDRQAISELYRVLKPGGVSIVLVPITSGPTREDPSVTDPRQREKLFGQFDHVRLYGSDFEDRLRQAGFTTACFTAADLATVEEVERLGLNQEDRIFLARKS